GRAVEAADFQAEVPFGVDQFGFRGGQPRLAQAGQRNLLAGKQIGPAGRRLAIVVDGELHQRGVSAVRTGDGAGELGLLAPRGGADLLAGQGRVGPFGVARAPVVHVDEVWWRV